MMRNKNRWAFFCLLVGIMLPFLMMSQSQLGSPNEMYLDPQTAANIGSNNTFPAANAQLYTNSPYNFTNNLRDDSNPATSWNRVVDSANLVVQQSDQVAYSNTSVTSLGWFNATYTFTDDRSGGLAAGFAYTGAGTFQVMDSVTGHRKVLNVDGTGSGWSGAYTMFTAITDNTINVSLWLRTPGTTWRAGEDLNFYVKQGATVGPYFAVYTNGMLAYYVAGWGNLLQLQLARWYYITCSVRLDTDRFDLYVDGVKVLNNGVFYNSNTITQIDRFDFNVYDKEFYIDALDIEHYDPGCYGTTTPGVMRNAIDGQYAYSGLNGNVVGVYNATYSFESDTMFSAPNGFTDDSGAGCYAKTFPQVATGAYGHHNVLCMEDRNAATQTQFHFSFTAAATGTIELWYLSTIANQQTVLLELRSGGIAGTRNILLYHDPATSAFKLYTAGTDVAIGQAIVANTWYHIRLQFSCTANTQSVWINGMLKASNIPLVTGYAASVDTYMAWTGGATQTTAYIDALDLSTDSQYYPERSSFLFLNATQSFQVAGAYSSKWQAWSAGIAYDAPLTPFTVGSADKTVYFSLDYPSQADESCFYLYINSTYYQWNQLYNITGDYISIAIGDYYDSGVSWWEITTGLSSPSVLPLVNGRTYSFGLEIYELTIQNLMPNATTVAVDTSWVRVIGTGQSRDYWVIAGTYDIEYVNELGAIIIDSVDVSTGTQYIINATFVPTTVWKMNVTEGLYMDAVMGIAPYIGLDVTIDLIEPTLFKNEYQIRMNITSDKFSLFSIHLANMTDIEIETASYSLWDNGEYFITDDILVVGNSTFTVLLKTYRAIRRAALNFVVSEIGTACQWNFTVYIPPQHMVGDTGAMTIDRLGSIIFSAIGNPGNSYSFQSDWTGGGGYYSRPATMSSEIGINMYSMEVDWVGSGRWELHYSMSCYFVTPVTLQQSTIPLAFDMMIVEYVNPTNVPISLGEYANLNLLRHHEIILREGPHEFALEQAENISVLVSYGTRFTATSDGYVPISGASVIASRYNVSFPVDGYLTYGTFMKQMSFLVYKGETLVGNTTYDVSYSSANFPEERVYINVTDVYLSDVYISAFSNDLLGIPADSVRLYIEGERKPWGICQVASRIVNLTVLDYFNSTQYTSNLDLSEYAEFNVFINMATLSIFNNDSVNYFIFNITKSGLVLLSQPVAPLNFLIFRFTTGSYTIDCYYENNTLYSTQYINLAANDTQLISFGVQPSHAYTVSIVPINQYGIGLPWESFQLFVNGTQYAWGVSSFTSTSISAVAKDYFGNTINTTVFNLFDGMNCLVMITSYSFKLTNLMRTSTLVNWSRNGISWMEYVGPGEITQWDFYGGDYVLNYTQTETDTPVNVAITVSGAGQYTINTSYFNVFINGYPTGYPDYALQLDNFRLYIGGSGTEHFWGMNELLADNYVFQVKDLFGKLVYNAMIGIVDATSQKLALDVFSFQIQNLMREDTYITINSPVNYLERWLLAGTYCEIYVAADAYNLLYTQTETNTPVSANIALTGATRYIMNTSYYDTYFSVYSPNLPTIPREQFRLYVNGTLCDWGFVSLLGDPHNITVLDWFNASLYSQVLYLNATSELMIPVSVYSAKIQNLMREDTLVNLTRLGILINEHVLSGEIAEFYLFPGTYSLDYVNTELNTTISTSLVVAAAVKYVINTSYYTVYFSSYASDRLGIPDDTVRLYINGTRYAWGPAEILGDNHSILVLDYFDGAQFNATVDFHNLTEYNIQINMITIYIYNNDSMNPLLFTVAKVGITFASGSVGTGMPYQFRGTPGYYAISAYYDNGTICGSGNATLGTNGTAILNFGFYKELHVPDPNLVGSSIVDVIILIVIAGIFGALFFVATRPQNLIEKAVGKPGKLKKQVTRDWKPPTDDADENNPAVRHQMYLDGKARKKGDESKGKKSR